MKTLCTTAALLSLAVLFLPDKKGIRTSALTLFSLIFLLVLISLEPNFSLSSLLPSDESESLPPSAEYTETMSAAVADGIRADIAERFSLKKETVVVKSDLLPTAEGLLGTYLTVSLYGSGFFADTPRLLAYLKETYHESCEVFVYAAQAPA